MGVLMVVSSRRCLGRVATRMLRPCDRSADILLRADAGVNPALSDSAVGALLEAHQRLPYNGHRREKQLLAGRSREPEYLPRDRLGLGRLVHAVAKVDAVAE